MDPSTHTNESPLKIPPGYTACEMDGRLYLVPNFLLPATKLALETQKIQRSLNIQQATGGVSAFFVFHCQ
jgi:hypothetical protein